MRTSIRNTVLALVLTAGFAPALAQTPPPVPALPDTERRTSYSITASTCACAVGFQLYGDSTDVANWLEVFVNGVRMSPTSNWTITSPTGPLATIPRPITDAVLTFTVAQTGTIQIVGARRPRRTSQFQESQPVPTRNFNQTFSDIIATQRELWDKTNDVTGRAVMAPPGETLALLPILASRQNMGACFDSGGNLQPCVAAAGSFIAGTGIQFTGTNPTTISTLPGVTPTLSGTNTWTGTNTYQGDSLFANGRPWCDVRAMGAVGDGVTDDAPAFNACIAQIMTTKGYGSGIVFIPPSASLYCLKSTIYINTGLTTNGGIIFQGAGVQGTVIGVSNTCGANNIIAFRINNQWVSIRDMSIYGYGFGVDPVFSGTAPAAPAVQCDAGASFFNMHNVGVAGGIAAIELQCSNYVLDNVSTSYAYGDGSRVFGMVYTLNGGGSIRDSHLDQIFPAGTPAHGTAIAAWAPGTNYPVGRVVSVTCNARTWFIQAVKIGGAGTSGGSAPACKPYGTNIADNVTGNCSTTVTAGVCWLLVNASTSYCMQIDTGSVEVEIFNVDMTCTANYNLGVTNTFAGTVPSLLHFTQSTPGLGFSGNIYLNSGSHVTMLGMETSFCLSAGCSAVLIDGAAVSHVKIIGLDCSNGLAYCVNITAPVAHILMTQVQSFGADTAVLNVSAAVQGFSLMQSESTNGSANLFSIAAVAADHYIITNNICNGVSSSDAGTGTHKTVTACSGAGP